VAGYDHHCPVRIKRNIALQPTYIHKLHSLFYLISSFKTF
jgi:hypothetical protein